MRGFVVGLTGGVGAGKSALAQVLRRMGAAVYSVDEAAHVLYLPGRPLTRRLLRAFGGRIAGRGGSINRPRLSRLVTANGAALRTLERIVHPALAREAASAVRRMRRLNRLVVVEAGPLLFRLGLHRFSNLVVLVDCPVRERARRLAAAGRSSRGKAARLISAFAGAEAEMRKEARGFKPILHIDTNGPPGVLEAAARRVAAWAVG